MGRTRCSCASKQPQEHRIVDVEPAAAKANESLEEKLARWKSEILGSAAPLCVEPGGKGGSEKAMEKPEVEGQHAEDRFKQTQGLSHGCRQSLNLLQVVWGKFSTATGEAEVTRLESEVSFLQVIATMSLKERLRQVKVEICGNRRQIAHVRLESLAGAENPYSPDAGAWEGAPDPKKWSHCIRHRVPGS
jgi:hypothetical protein